MPTSKLRQHLAELREEIDRADAGDHEALSALRDLAVHIERELDEEKRIGDARQLVEDIESSVSGFEASHPNLTAILNNILVLLGGMGV